MKTLMIVVLGTMLMTTNVMAGAWFCTVADPGYPSDPLNVRNRPAGAIVEKLPNGLDVEIFDRQGDWVYISYSQDDNRGSGNGWVFRKYLFCPRGLGPGMGR
jgi:hypothetical protein